MAPPVIIEIAGGLHVWRDRREEWDERRSDKHRVKDDLKHAAVLCPKTIGAI